KPLAGQLLLRCVQSTRGAQWLQYACATEPVRARLLADFAKASHRGAVFSLATVFQQYLAGPAPGLAPQVRDIVVLWGDSDESRTPTLEAPGATSTQLC